MLKVIEKDQGCSYETEPAEMRKKLGCTIASRMSSRISSWAIGKWQAHRQLFSEDMEIAFQMLQAKCAAPEHMLPTVPIKHMRNVLAGSKRRTGLGCDQWPLHLWSYLPDEGLRGLQLIVRNMFKGKITLQAPCALISFLEKMGGESGLLG